MNFSELKAELAARGFDYLSDERLGQYVNWARAELDDTELWPYRQDSVTGTTGVDGVSVIGLGTVRYVADLDQNYRLLVPADREWLAHNYGDLSTQGTPEFFYVDGEEIVRPYPVGGTLEVRHWATTDELTDDASNPTAPIRFHRLYVDLAVERAYRDSDNHAEAEQLRVAIERDLNAMRSVLFRDQLAGPQGRVQTGYGFWG